MADAPVIPLIVDGEKFPRRAPRGACAPPRLVSIGRLDHFKTYNLTMLSVVRRLRDLGHDVSWDVYGTGMLQSRMTSKIAELNLGRHVRLMGNVDYRRIPEVLADAFAFIGSGLSMMEASACGVPSLPAIEYADLPQTFGFPHEIEGISFFEPSLPLPRQDIGDRLIDLLQRPSVTRVGPRCRDSSLRPWRLSTSRPSPPPQSPGPGWTPLVMPSSKHRPWLTATASRR
jgi:glycosyltransferase involved in cell wall biosynthesis